MNRAWRRAEMDRIADEAVRRYEGIAFSDLSGLADAGDHPEGRAWAATCAPWTAPKRARPARRFALWRP